MKTIYITIIFLLSVVTNTIGQTQVDLGVVTVDKENYRSTSISRDTQFEIIFDLNSYVSITFSSEAKIGNADFWLISLENTDTKKKYTPDRGSIHDGDGAYFEYSKLEKGRYKITLQVAPNSNVSPTSILFKCQAILPPYEKREIQFGNLSRKEGDSYSTPSPLTANTSFEIFFDIDIESFMDLTYYPENGYLRLELLYIENRITGEKEIYNETNYWKIRPKLKAGKYKAVILASDGYSEAYIAFEATPDIKLDLGNLTENLFGSRTQNICTNTPIEILFRVTSLSDITFNYAAESGSIKFEGFALQGHSPYETKKEGNSYVNKYKLGPGNYRINLIAKADHTCSAKAVFSCFAQDLTPPPPILTKNKNYVITKRYTRKDNSDWMEQIQYYDGLGRPDQTIQKGITPSKSDLVFLQEYDGFGRDSETWLPVVIKGSNGAFVDVATVKDEAKKADSNNDTHPFSKPIYESSPLNRVVEQYGPGSDWQVKGKSVKTKFLSNTTSGVLACALFTVDGIGPTTKVKKNDYYPANTLYVTSMTDEDQNISYEFIDKLGQVILIRQMVGTIQHDTYYVYDDYGNLSFVLPPLASEGLIPHNEAWDEVNSTVVKQYAYIYRYDSRNRCTWKKIPGVEPVFYIYDKADRIIFSQDGEQRKNSEWLFAVTDILGRDALNGTVRGNPAIKLGMWDSILTAPIVIAKYTGALTNLGYQVTGYTFTPSVLISANFYDDYTFLGKHSIPNNTHTQYEIQAGYQPSNNGRLEKSFLTGTITSQLPTGSMLYTVIYYDHEGRVIQTKSNNHLGGKDKEFVAYNFLGQPIKKLHEHTVNNKLTTEVYSYDYDHAGRLLTTHHELTVDGNTKPKTLLTSNTYDELGRLLTSEKGNNTSKISTDYKYNIRSWITEINSKRSSTLLFNQKLAYNVAPTSGTMGKAQWGGNISGMTWQVTGENTTRGYKFEYDQLSRVTDAVYVDNPKTNNNYTTKYSYDKHGNFTSISRYGNTSGKEVDKLSFSYLGNQLINVKDTGVNNTNSDATDFLDYANSAGVYAYNANGAMSKDTHKGISQINYNSLNLPSNLTIKNSNHDGNINYIYSASGQKLQTVHNINPDPSHMSIMGAGTYASAGIKPIVTDYVGNKVYEGKTLNKILVDGGYFDIEKDKYFYYLTDHLGNNRMVAEDNGNVIQHTHYYPFGMAFPEAKGKNEQAYKYNGKEQDTRLGLNLYDYSARYLDNAIGRFTSIDPHAENYYSWSPYAYVGNNPMRLTDPTGMDWYYSEDGVLLGRDDLETQNVWVAANNSYMTQGGSTVILESGLTQIMDNLGEAMSHDTFMEIAGTLYAEGSSTWEEAAGIYSVMENRGNADNKTVSDVAKGGGIYGYSERDKINSIYANKDHVQNANKGLIQGALSAKDYSGGGYYWHGVDFGKSSWRANKDYYQVGFNFTNSSHDLWGQGSRTSGNSKWNYKYESTGASGRTTYMKLTESWKKQMEQANGMEDHDNIVV